MVQYLSGTKANLGINIKILILIINYIVFMVQYLSGTKTNLGIKIKNINFNYK